MNNGKIAWHGSFAAVVTPFHADGEIDEKKFAENLELLLSEGAAGFLVSGSTGESWSLDVAEKIRLFKLAKQIVGDRVPLIGGTGEIRTDRVIEASFGAKESGMGAVLVIPPYYAESSHNAIVNHFRRISDAVKMPIISYNHPHTSGVNLDESYLPELIDIEWVVATKESAGDFNQLSRLLVAYGDQIDIFTGYSARHGCFGAMMGSPVFIGAMETQVLGAEGFSLFELAGTGQVEEAVAVQKRCIRMSAIGKIGSSPANIKAAMNLLGRPGGYCRNPIDDLTESEMEAVRNVLDELDLFSSPACRL